jgi:hypothetical protein
MFYGTLSKLSSLKLPSTSRRTIQCLLQAKLGGMNNEKKIPERSKTYTVYNFVEIWNLQGKNICSSIVICNKTS